MDGWVDGWIEVICGCMFSGKTEELIRRVTRAVIANQGVLVLKHVFDNRYKGVHKISAHNGLSIEATPIRTVAEIMPLVEEGTQVVAIDEVQFFSAKNAPSLSVVCRRLADRGIRVICAGLDTNFRGEPFGPTAILMAEAERVTKLHAVCMVCGRDNASFTQRLIDGNPAPYGAEEILVGGKESYEARCRRHHLVPGRPE